MKKFLLVLLSLVSLTCFLTACNENNNEVCSHSYSEWIIVDEATCLEDGLKSHTCSKCGNIETQIVEAFGHTAVVDARVEPTCTSTGLTEGKHCSSCNTVLINQEIIEKLEHSEVIHEAKAPTCTNVGWSEYVTCEREGCQYSTYNEISATGNHTWDSGEITTQPTCTTKGIKTFTCEVCYTAIKTEDVKEIAHNYTTSVTAPTCTEQGYTTYTCYCNDTYKSNYVSATGHSYGDWISNDDNTHTKTCERDSTHTITENCSGGEATCTAKAVCENCRAEYGDFLPQKLSYTVNTDNKTCTITSIGTYISTDIYIPSNIDNYTVTAIADKAFENQTHINILVLPDTIKTIGTRAFYGCTGLQEINIPFSVTSIGTQIFYQTEKLHTVYYNSTYSDFNTNTLTNNNPIFGVSNISKVVFNGSEIPKGILAGNSNDIKIIVKDNVTTIGTYAFYNCSNFTEITLSKGVKKIGQDAFKNCSNLKDIYYNGLIEDWFNISFSKSVGGIYRSNPLCNGANLYLNGVLLTSLSIPEKITHIPYMSFYGCSSLTNVIIPNNVTSIGFGAFYKCTSLSSITLSPNVTTIGYEAFYLCESLKNVYYNGTIENWLSISFEKNFDGDYESNPLCNGANLYFKNILATNLTVPDTVSVINDCAFEGCNSLTSIEISNSVISIGNYAFKNSVNLTRVILSNNISKIGYNTFENCTNLASIQIPDSVTSIASSAFKNCQSLKNLTIGKNVKSIYFSAFEGCCNLTNVEIPDSVTKLDDSIFKNCTSLETVIIGKGIEKIPSYLFRNCTNLTKIIIPSSITSINWYAFDNCLKLENVFYAGTAAEWDIISIDYYNSYLKSATRYYYSETQPATSGICWHYVDGVPTIW